MSVAISSLSVNYCIADEACDIAGLPPGSRRSSECVCKSTAFSIYSRDSVHPSREADFGRCCPPRTRPPGHPARTEGLHPPVTASHAQPAPMPLLTAKTLHAPQRLVESDSSGRELDTHGGVANMVTFLA